MAREIPEVVRAAAGLAATVLDEARKLPETLPGLPVRLIGMAMQHAMKVQQHYASFVARGDELFTGLRGEDEPGLATFDDEPAPAPAGFRESAFDRAGDAEGTGADVDLILDEELADAEQGPDTEEILDEIAIDELIDQAPALEETAPGTPAPAKKAAKKAAAKQAAAEQTAAEESTAKAPAKKSQAGKKATASPPTASSASASPAAADTVDAEPTADVATTVDVLTPAGDVEAVEATVTDEGVAAPEGDATTTDTATTDTATTDTATAATATDEGGSPVAAAPAPSPGTAADAGTASDTPSATGAAATPGASANGGPGGNAADSSTAPRTPPIDGYDAFTVAQLRGRLRGYALSTVEELVAYEQATRARAPYLTMLRNRLEKLEEQAIQSSPLAPRGA